MICVRDVEYRRGENTKRLEEDDLVRDENEKPR